MDDLISHWWTRNALNSFYIRQHQIIPVLTQLNIKKLLSALFFSRISIHFASGLKDSAEGIQNSCRHIHTNTSLVWIQSINLTVSLTSF